MSPSRPTSRIPGLVAALALLALPAWIACGGDEKEDALSSAMEEIAEVEKPQVDNRKQARALLDAARLRLAQHGAGVDQAAAEVEIARAELESAESVLEQARNAYATTQSQVEQAAQQMRQFSVPDPTLFRNVQRELLEASALREVAIAADVNNGVVTLRGRVPNADIKGTAVRLVNGIDGVISVDDRIEVAGSE